MLKLPSEDYLSKLSWSEKECLRLLYERTRARTSELARVLNLSNSTVTELLQKLARKGLVIYERYRGVSLSNRGRFIATEIMRRHRLLEALFVNLGLSPDEACMEARKFDYLISKELASRICKHLDEPRFCPCGKQIPKATM